MATTDELLNLDGIGQRLSEVRYDILDLSLATIGTVTPLAASTPTVAVDSGRAIMRSLSSLRLGPVDQAAINPFADRIRPVWVLENGATFSMGVFIFGGMDRIRQEWGLEASVSAVDQTIILDQPTVTSTSYAAGVTVRSALIAQFQAVGITSYTIDSGITATIANPIGWPAGTSRLRVINDLAVLGGAYPAYFDRDGAGVVRAVLNSTLPAVTLTYDTGGRILVGSMVESDDLLDAPNRYIVIDSGSADRAIVGTYDIPPSAPNSAVARGFVVAEVISEQGLGSVAQAIERAKAAYAASEGVYQWVQFSSPPDPRHDTLDAVDYLGTLYREQRWSLPLAEGSEMTHDLRRAIT